MIGLALIPFFCKMTGSGNDFILIDNRSQSITTDQCNSGPLACRPQTVTGADGLILVETDPEMDFMWRFLTPTAVRPKCAEMEPACQPGSFTFRVSSGNRIWRSGPCRYHSATIMEERVIQMTTPRDLQMDIFLQLEDGPFDLHAINTGVPHVVLW